MKAAAVPVELRRARWEGAGGRAFVVLPPPRRYEGGSAAVAVATQGCSDDGGGHRTREGRPKVASDLRPAGGRFGAAQSGTAAAAAAVARLCGREATAASPLLLLL